MRISYISQSTVPSRAANSIHVMKMCQALARGGHDVTLLTMDTAAGRERGVRDVYGYHGVAACFDIQNIPAPRMRGGSAVYGLLAARRAKTLKPDVVYGRHLAGCYFAAKLGLPVIFEAHHPWDDRRDIDAFMLSGLVRDPRLQRFVVITEALKVYYAARYAGLADKLFVAADGADPVARDVRPVALAGQGERLQVGYAGHLYAGKGMEIVSELAQRCDWADFHIVGGKDQDRAFWQARCAGLENLTFHGHVSPSEVATYIMAFDVALLPNQRVIGIGQARQRDIGSFTSPLKAFEYMAAGRAILASDLPVLREVFTDQADALLCAPDAIEMWEQALAKLRDDPDMRERLGNAARAKFLEHYTWQVRAAAVLGALPPSDRGA